MRGLPLVFLVGCTVSDEMGVLEALDALGQVNRSAEGEQATQGVIEVSTDFTIGGAIEDAATTVADFWNSQLPCTTVTVTGPEVVVDYGTLDDACVWHGRTYAGVNTSEFVSVTLGSLEVDHNWNGFTDGDVVVDGDATVTWSGNDASWSVVTDHQFVSVADPSQTVVVHGDHVTTPLEEGVAWWDSGFRLDGMREWTVDGEPWTLEMAELELRMLDPAPQAGTIDLVAPSGKSLQIVYARVDEDTISATLVGIRGGDRVYHISRLGAVEEAPATTP